MGSGRLLYIYTGHTSDVESVAFSSDGKRIVTGSWDDTARLWDVDYRDLVTEVCARLVRDLTPGERTAANITDNEPTCPQFGPQSVPMLPTAMPLPTRVIPVWTPLPSPTASNTEVPTLTATPTPVTK